MKNLRLALVCTWLASHIGTADAQQHCDTQERGLSAPTERFIDHGDGTVTDKSTRLMWLRCSLGQRPSAKGCEGDGSLMSWEAAHAGAVQINQRGSFFYNDWRLPSIRELGTIAERQCSQPRINLAVFPSTAAAGYWSATSRPSTPQAVEPDASAFALSFGAEGVDRASKSSVQYVRLVRNTP